LLKKHGVSENAIYEGAGCPDCDNTGFKGRTIISEVLMIDKNIEEMIAERRSIKDIVRYATVNTGMSSITKNALQKVVDGVTSLNEVEREVLF